MTLGLMTAAFGMITLLSWAFNSGPASAQSPEASAVSPALGIAPTADREAETYRSARSNIFRSIDGSANNRRMRAMGAALTPLRRRIEPDYADLASEPAGALRPGPRYVSNVVHAQDRAIPNPEGLSDFFWQWGQFLDHDLDLSDGVDPPEPMPIEVPIGDPHFDPNGAGTVEIPLNRSLYDKSTGYNAARPRAQLNEVTAWIDASNVYGSDPERAAALRTNDGTGRLRTSAGDLLPFNTTGLPNAGGDDPRLFLAGDVRVNEQVGLTALHTLFVREHNRLVDWLATVDPTASGDTLYQHARRIVGAQMQVITYNEFLPQLLGPNALEPYEGYDQRVDAGIAHVFAAAAYRFGHSALSPQLLRIDAAGNEIRQGHLPLRDAFFAPERITNEGGIDPLLRGLARQTSQRVDIYIIDAVRNFLFGAPGSGGFDLASLNIQRGRDHGLPSYNDVRQALGLARAVSFADISSDPEVQVRLASVYVDPDEVDLWVGGLAEDRVPGAQVGELFFVILKEQFEALRDGDRFWYQRALTEDEVLEVEATRLSDIVRRNTGIGGDLPDEVFRAQ